MPVCFRHPRCVVSPVFMYVLVEIGKIDECKRRHFVCFDQMNQFIHRKPVIKAEFFEKRAVCRIHFGKTAVREQLGRVDFD